METPSRTRRLLREHPLGLVVLAAGLGALIGGGVALLHGFVGVLQRFAFSLPAGASLLDEAAVPDWRVVATPVAGGLLLGVLVRVVRRWRPREIVDPIEANALFGGKMSLIDSLRLTLATVLSNGAGASVGMEAAYTQAGSGLVSAIGQWLRLRRGDLRTLVGCGAAAAIAAAYDAPLAGSFYAFELVLGGYTLANLAPVGAAAGMAVVAAEALAHNPPVMPVGQGGGIAGWEYLACGAVGFLAGWLSILTMQAVTLSERLFRAVPVPGWMRPALGGLGVGLLALAYPEVLGSGPGAKPVALDDGLLAVGALLAVKIVASALSLGAGFRGGLFSASLFLGGLFGGFLALAAHALVPGYDLGAMDLTLVGMGSMAAGIVGAPVTMVLLVLEVTSDIWAAAGVLIGVVVSTTVVRQAFGYSFATWRFHLRGVPIRGAQDIGWIAELRAERLMRRDFKTVHEGMTLADLRALYPLGGDKMVFAVDDAGCYAGMVDLAAVHDPSVDKAAAETPVRALARHRDAFLLPGDDIRTALQRFAGTEAEALPVVASSASHRVLGYLTEAFALRRYSRQLERQRGEELGEHSLYGRD